MPSTRLSRRHPQHDDPPPASPSVTKWANGTDRTHRLSRRHATLGDQMSPAAQRSARSGTALPRPGAAREAARVEQVVVDDVSAGSRNPVGLGERLLPLNGAAAVASTGRSTARCPERGAPRHRFHDVPYLRRSAWSSSASTARGVTYRLVGCRRFEEWTGSPTLRCGARSRR